MGIVLLMLAIVFNAVANSFFKAAAGLQDLTREKFVLIGLGLLIGLANTLCFVKALEEIDLGVAFPVFSAASIILIAIISLLFFKEGLSLQKAAGLTTICIGLLLIWKS